jgi:hypothetical protein
MPELKTISDLPLFCDDRGGSPPFDPSGHVAFFIAGGSLRAAIQRCCSARIGWERTILGPENFITSRIFALIAGR